MRIAILNTQCPFVTGGAELHARNLERVLRQAGHDAEIVSMPFKWYPSTTVLDHMLAAKALDVSEFNGVKIDLAIGLKFPAYLMRHPNKVFWVLHQHRQAYDLWDSGHSDLYDDDGQLVRSAIHEADREELGRARKLFANSANVAARLRRYNGITAEPLYHPPPLEGRLYSGELGGYFYYPSRIAAIKRQDLAIRALCHADRDVRIVFSGAPDNPEYGDELKLLTEQLGVSDRVEWRGYVSQDEMIALYAGARSVVYTPLDEDLGYVALEAMLAGKALVTLADSGEPAALVRDGGGLVCEADPVALGAALTKLSNSPALAGDLGRAARARYDALGISWSNVIERLTGAAPALAPPPAAIAASPSLGVDKMAATSPPRDDRNEAGIALDELFASYDFGRHVVAHRPYYEVHWRRYNATLRALHALRASGLRPRRILDIGGSPPYVFTALIKQCFPEAGISIVQQSPAGVRWTDRMRSMQPDQPDIELDVAALNIETHALPFADGEFDLVIAMELLEHLAVDPSFFFQEAMRVLRVHGRFLVTTPNLVSRNAVWRALNGVSPYSFGQFVPWEGVYGRHNREYTPDEVDALGRFVGFETDHLGTEDVFEQGETPPALEAFIKAKGQPLTLRGQNIFYVGHKPATPKHGPLPESLFPVDPRIFTAKMTLLPSASGDYELEIINHSRSVWPASGPQCVRGSISRMRQSGQVEPDVISFALPRDLQPGAAARFHVAAAAARGADGSWFEVGLVLEGCGPFAEAGRCRTVSLFADSLVISER